MVCTVVFPETVVVVHDPMIPVKPKVQDDAVQTDLERKPFPVHAVYGGLGVLVSEHKEHQGPERRRGDQRRGNLADMTVRNAVSGKLVSIEESISMAHPAHRVNVMDRSSFESNSVEQECAPHRHVLAHDEDVGLVDGEGDEGMNDDPSVHNPCRNVWNRICLFEHRNGHVEVGRMEPESFHRVFPESPAFLVVAPSAGQRPLAQRRCGHRLCLRLARHSVVARW